jgi:hypothetical protein
MPFRGFGDCLMESTEGGSGFETEFRDEAREVGFVGLVRRLLSVPDWVLLISIFCSFPESYCTIQSRY